MEVKYPLDLSRFSEEELRSFANDGIISRHEFINELNRRKTEKDYEVKAMDAVLLNNFKGFTSP